MTDKPLWQITEMPQPTFQIGWNYRAELCRCDGIRVRIIIEDQASEEDANIIVQQFAGILTPLGHQKLIEDYPDA